MHDQCQQQGRVESPAEVITTAIMVTLCWIAFLAFLYFDKQ